MICRHGKPVAALVTVDEMHARIEAKIESWQEEDGGVAKASEESAQDARPVWWKRWWG